VTTPEPPPLWRHSGPCIYCPQHGPACVSCDTPTPEGPIEQWPVCGECALEFARREIAADPYYRGDYYAMFGDDE
jgi:hypothetical protein